MCFSVVNINNNSQNGYEWIQLKCEDKTIRDWHWIESSIVMTSGRTIEKKKKHEVVFKTPVVIGEIHVALLTLVCGFSSVSRCERRAVGAQSTRLPTWLQSILWHERLHTLQIWLKSLQAARINWSLERTGTVNISALTENCFKAFLTELCDFREDHPISKIHNRELVLSPAQSSSFCVYWPFEMPLFQFQPKLLLNLNLSHISPSPLFFKKKKCILWIKPFSVLKERLA